MMQALLEHLWKETLLITSQRHESARSILQSWGDTAPAMGMIGTLIGLVILLKNLEEDPGGIGAGMSIALINYFLWSNFGKWRLNTNGTEA